MKATRSVSKRRIDDGIAAYIESRRKQIGPFIEKNFSFGGILNMPTRRLLRDFGRHIVNSITVLPYLTLKKSAEALEKLGWDLLYKKVKLLPPGFKTELECDFAHLIYSDFFEIPYSESSAQKSDVFAQYLDATSEIDSLQKLLRKQLYEGLQEWVDRRTIWIDMSSSVLVWLTGLLAFDDMKLGIFEIGKRMASWWSYQSSSSHFFLGKGAGKVFYGIFPPQPNGYEVILWTLLLMFGFAIVTYGISLTLDPLQKKLGLHERNLHKLLDTLEVKLLLAVRKSSKS